MTEKDGAQGHLERSHVCRRKKLKQAQQQSPGSPWAQEKNKDSTASQNQTEKRIKQSWVSVSDLIRESHYHCVRGKQRHIGVEVSEERKRAKSQSCRMSEQ